MMTTKISSLILVLFCAAVAEAAPPGWWYCGMCGVWNPPKTVCRGRRHALRMYPQQNMVVARAPRYKLSPSPVEVYQGAVREAPAEGKMNAFAATPYHVMVAMLAELDLTPDDILYDLGCGDGRFLIAAVEQYGCMAVGIERDPSMAALARANVQRAGCGRIRIVEDDFTKYKLDGATAAVMYLWPEGVHEAVSRLRTDRIASYSHPLPDRPCRAVRAGKGVFYVPATTAVGSTSDWSGL